MSKARATKRKKLRKGKKARGAKVVRRIRFAKEQVMQIHRLIGGGDTAAARRAIHAFHPQLADRDMDELLIRIGDPQGQGGITTGFDPKIGEYADIALTS